MKCENCGSPARFNLQKIWIEYSINKDGEYSTRSRHIDNQDPYEDNNLHYCKICRDKFVEDEL